MRKNKLLSITLILAMAASVFAGCGTDTKTTSDSKAAAANIADIKEVYENTAFVSVEKRVVATTESSSVPTTQTPADGKASENVDVVNCGSLNTVDAQFKMPKITADENTNYFSPVVGEGIKSVTFVEDLKQDKELGDAETDGTTASVESSSEASKGDYVSNINVSVDGKDTTCFKLNKAGIYEVELESSKIKVTVKDGSLYDDVMNESAVKNILVNTESKEFKDRASEYENTLPILIADYMKKYPKKDEALNALKTENADLFKEFNRINMALGKEVMSFDDIVATYGTAEKINAAKEAESTTTKRGLASRAGSASTLSDNGGSNTANLAYQAFTIINNYRVSNGLPALTWSQSDANVAAVRAKELVSNFSHTSASGTKTMGGENIARTSDGSAQTVANGWINSPGHRANILRESFTTCGLAVVYENGFYFWSHNFSYPTKTDANGNVTVDTNKLFSGNGVTVENKTDANGGGYTVKTDSSGNKIISVGPQYDAEGWANAHWDMSKCKIKVYYNGESVEMDHFPTAAEIDWSKTPFERVNVCEIVNIVLDSGIGNIIDGMKILLYKDGHTEVRVQPKYLVGSTNNLSSLVGRKVQISKDHKWRVL